MLLTRLLAALAFLSNEAIALKSHLSPPVLPLAVRNPYLSAWLGNAREEPWTSWPMFYTRDELGLSIMVSVPSTNTVYPLLGRPQDHVKSDDSEFSLQYPIYKGAVYDASTTNFTYSILDGDFNIGNQSAIDITVSFLSPITPTSTFRQALPASYISVEVSGKSDVAVYLDVNGKWASHKQENDIVWDYHEYRNDKHSLQKMWEFKRREELLFTEDADRAEWGTMVITGPSDAESQNGASGEVKTHFARHSKLKNSYDGDHRRIGDREPVFAFSKTLSLGNATRKSESETVLFTIAQIQDPAIQFAAARGRTFMRPLWASYFSNWKDMLLWHYNDFKSAAALAGNYSQQLQKDAYASGADDYVDIVSLSARQVMGATSFVGTPDDPLLFLKEISSDGNTQTIDVIYPAFPFFMYTNPKWLGWMLEPILENTLSGQYPNQYAMHDIGASFPNATGHPDGNDEYMPLEECGNILIMALSLVNSLRYGENDSPQSFWSAQGADDMSTLDDSSMKALALVMDQQHHDDRWGGNAKGEKQAKKWIGESYRLWKQWTSYLIEFALEPTNQLSTDDFAGWLPLQTGLALKGIIGIRAMASIAELMGENKDAAYYKNVSATYIKKWEEYATSRDGTHIKLAYDWQGSWTTVYNLYADSLLCFHNPGSSKAQSLQHGNNNAQQPLISEVSKDNSSVFVPSHIYKMQSDWYLNVRQKYGLPLDSRHLYTKTDWEFWAMAIASKKARTLVLESVAKWVNETRTDKPLTDLHNTEGDGGYPGPDFFARPVVGGHFAFLALERACGGKAVEGLKFLDAES